MTNDPTGGNRREPGSATAGSELDAELEAQLSAYLDGELEADAERAIEEAVQASPALQQRLAQFREADAQLRALSARPAPPDLSARLRTRIAAEDAAAAATGAPAQEVRRRAPARPSRTPRRTRWRAPALAAIAAAVIAVWLIPRLRTPSPGVEIAEHIPPIERTDPTAEQTDPTAEEIVVALALESDRDLEVIEVLDWLEELGDFETDERG